MEFVVNIETKEIYLIVSEAETGTGKVAYVLRNIDNPEKALLIEPKVSLDSEKYKKISNEKLCELIKTS